MISRIAPLLLTVFAFSCVSEVAFAQQNWAKELFEIKKHDFGPVSRGSKAEYRFQFTNTTGKDIVVSKLKSSCGCTSPSMKQGRIKPGEVGEIIAKFNTDSFIGLKSAVVTVVFGEPSFAEVQLNVSGFIRTDVTLNPAEINFGSFRAGESKPITVTVSYAGSVDWKIEDVRSQFQHLQVSLSNRTKTSSGYKYDMKVGLKESTPIGSFRERMTLVTNEQSVKLVSLDVVGKVDPDLILTPESVSIGAIRKSASIVKRIVLRGPAAFEITEVKSKDRRFQFKKPVGKKPLHFVTMTFTAGQVPGKVLETIEIKTDLKGGRTAECQVSGEVL